MQKTQIPAKFAAAWANAAGSGFIRSIPAASQINVGGMQGAASLADGFPPLCFLPVGSGGVPPAGQDFNGILNQITAWNQWQAAGGTVPFDQTFANGIGGYPYGALVQSTTNGRLWFNTADNNTTNPDAGGAANWLALDVGTASTSSPTYPANRNAMSLIPAGVQAIPSGVETAIAWGAPPAGSDPLGFWSASDPTRITNPTGGPTRIRISAALAFFANGTGYRYARLIQNGGAVWQNGRVADRVPTGAQICVCQMTGFPSTIALNPGDYFQLLGFQNSGGSLNTDYGTSGTGQTACKLVVEW